MARDAPQSSVDSPSRLSPAGQRVAESSGPAGFQASTPDPSSHCRDPPDPALCPASPSPCYYPAPYFGPAGEQDGDDEDGDDNDDDDNTYLH